MTIDSISEPLRDRLWEWSFLDVTPEQRRRREWLAGDPEKGSETVGLINCGHCAGWWLSLGTVAVTALAQRRRWHWLDGLIAAVAVAGVQSTLASLQGAFDTVGHVDAEELTAPDEPADEA